MRLNFLFILIFSTFTVSSQLPSFKLGGLSRALSNTAHLSKEDTSNKDISQDFNIIFDLAIDGKLNRYVNLYSELRLGSNLEVFDTSSSYLKVRRLLIFGDLSNDISFELGDIDLIMTPFTLWNNIEEGNVNESNLFANLREIQQYENYNFGNLWRRQGVKIFGKKSFLGKDSLNYKMFGSRRVLKPHSGKTELAKERLRKASKIMVNNGANAVDLTQVLGGYGAETLHMYSFFNSVEHAFQVSASLQNDKAWGNLMAEREAAPAADMTGPELARVVAGEGNPDHNAAMVREYVLPRKNLAEAAAMVSTIPDMLAGHDVNVTMWAPVIAEDMKRAQVVYSAPDMVVIGKAIDEVGMSSEFQEMLVKASNLGTLDRACGMVRFE